MLLQKALRELDGEIDRLTRIRAIVATLHTTSSPANLSFNLPDLLEIATPEPAAAPASVAGENTEISAPVVARRFGRKLRMERSIRTRRPAPPVARALGGEIPARPVFIASGSARPEAKVSPAKPASPPPVQEGTLDALLRELARRPSPGL